MNNEAIKRSEKRAEQARVLHALGLSTSEIADVIGVSNSAIFDYYKKIGVQPNPPTRRHASHVYTIEVLTLDLCDECIFTDCKWPGGNSACPMQIGYYETHKNAVEGQDEFFGWE